MNVRPLLIASLLAFAAATSAEAQGEGEAAKTKKRQTWVVRKLDAAKLLAKHTQRSARDIERAVRARFGEHARVLSQASREVVVAAPEQDLSDLDGPNVERIMLEIEDRTRDEPRSRSFYVSPKELYLLRTDPVRARRLPIGMVLRAARDLLDPKPGAELRIDVIADGNYVGELPNAGLLLAHWNSMSKTERLQHLSDAKRDGSLPAFNEWEAPHAVYDRQTAARPPVKPRKPKGATQAEKILEGKKPAASDPAPEGPLADGKPDDWVPPARYARSAKPLPRKPLPRKPEHGAQQSIEQLVKPGKTPK